MLSTGKGILAHHLEVKDTFAKLHPLSCVRNCVVKATLRQPKHLKHRRTKSANAALTFYTLQSCFKLILIQVKMSHGSPEQQCQSSPHSTFQWRTYTHDRSVPKCYFLVPTTESTILVKCRVCSYLPYSVFGAAEYQYFNLSTKIIFFSIVESWSVKTNGHLISFYPFLIWKVMTICTIFTDL